MVPLTLPVPDGAGAVVVGTDDGTFKGRVDDGALFSGTLGTDSLLVGTGVWVDCGVVDGGLGVTVTESDGDVTVVCPTMGSPSVGEAVGDDEAGVSLAGIDEELPARTEEGWVAQPTNSRSTHPMNTL
jgi:hypothetical protein